MRFKRWALALAVCLGVMAVAFIGRAALILTDPARGLETARIARGDIEETAASLGKVQPRAYVDVGAQASGQLRRLLVKPGDRVTAGQLLAEIDPQLERAKIDADRAERDRLRAALIAANARAAFAAGELARQSRLRAADATRTDVFEQAVRDAKASTGEAGAIRAQIAGADSILRSDMAQLGYTRIFAPMSGTIVSIDARPGQTINATYATPVLMRIADLTTMTVWTQVSEADIGRLRLGMKLWFTTLGFGSRRWDASLRQILPAPSRAAATDAPATGAQAGSNAAIGNVVLYTALFDVGNGDGLLRPEMSAQVFFILDDVKQVATVPMTALTPTDAPDRRPSHPAWHGMRRRFSFQAVAGSAPKSTMISPDMPSSASRTLPVASPAGISSRAFARNSGAPDQALPSIAVVKSSILTSSPASTVVTVRTMPGRSWPTISMVSGCPPRSSMSADAMMSTLIPIASIPRAASSRSPSRSAGSSTSTDPTYFPPSRERWLSSQLPPTA